MALVHPSLSMVGHKRGKTKFKNADEARRSRELDASWAELQAKWGVQSEDKKRSRAMSAPTLDYKLSAPVGRSTTNHIPSRDTGHSGAISSKEIPKYTGDSMIGISIQHKSCLQPVFTEEQAKDSASMRR